MRWSVKYPTTFSLPQPKNEFNKGEVKGRHRWISVNGGNLVFYIQALCSKLLVVISKISWDFVLLVSDLTAFLFVLQLLGCYLSNYYEPFAIPFYQWEVVHLQWSPSYLTGAPDQSGHIKRGAFLSEGFWTWLCMHWAPSSAVYIRRVAAVQHRFVDTNSGYGHIIIACMFSSFDCLFFFSHMIVIVVCGWRSATQWEGKQLW